MRVQRPYVKPNLGKSQHVSSVMSIFNTICVKFCPVWGVIMNNFGLRLENLREKSGYSKKEMSLLLGFTPNVYGSYEREERRPSLETLVKLAGIFDVSLDYLITGEENYDRDTIRVSDAKSEYRLRGKRNNLSNYKGENEVFINDILEMFKKAEISKPYILQVDKWATLSKEDFKELSNHFDWVVEKARRRKQKESDCAF